MTHPIIFHELAENEMSEAAVYYAHARPGLGDAFIAEVRYAVDLVAAFPLAGSAVERDVRWRPVMRYPYSLLYLVRDDHIRILAVAHQKRRPFYWRRRL